MMARWLKFNAAGILGVGAQMGALYLLTHFVGLNYLIATAIAVETAILHNFVWHERYTWRLRTRVDPHSALRRLLHFNLSNGMVSLVGNLLLMKLFVEWLDLPILAANLGAIAACSTLNFVIAEYFVFAAKPDVHDGGLFV
jgi:putative flippase GtrA